ncbi:MAG: 23S rRNA (guanosine(2251)-2'-O)-methyltransferase RlmB [Chloroflexi bacterium]|nr:23S rRNA (guanosine(2251)-2'-O)-methyltransferase RlmB [Chloroflexota bacterium]MQC27286.1 23S rRNA (guanosine(2251)-2'-O)-methyltransferase RlmB [Chloroflexota bacterium]
MAEWIYGRNAVYETLRAGRRKFHQLKIAKGVKDTAQLETIKGLSAQKGVAIEEVARPELDKLSSGHQGLALQVGDYPYSDIGDMLTLAHQRREPPFLLLLDTLQDPQNLGTLLRSAEAVGVHGVVLPHRRTATVTPAVVNASSGASEHLLISQDNLAQTIALLKGENVWIIGLEGSDGAQPVGEVKLDGPLALVVGSEGEGMRRLVRESCDVLLALPMRGQIESLNAAVAGSIVLYMAWLARNQSADG